MLIVFAEIAYLFPATLVKDGIVSRVSALILTAYHKLINAHKAKFGNVTNAFPNVLIHVYLVNLLIPLIIAIALLVLLLSVV